MDPASVLLNLLALAGRFLLPKTEELLSVNYCTVTRNVFNVTLKRADSNSQHGVAKRFA